MKLIISVFFTIVTLIGSVGAAEFSIYEKKQSHDFDQSSDFVPLTVITNMENLDDTSSHHSTSNCEHSCSLNHNCHLGHCAFLISQSISILNIAPQPLLPTVYVLGFVFDFHTNLFRPPIS